MSPSSVWKFYNKRILFIINNEISVENGVNGGNFCSENTNSGNGLSRGDRCGWL